MLPPDGASCKIYEREKPSSSILGRGDEERGKKRITRFYLLQKENCG